MVSLRKRRKQPGNRGNSSPPDDHMGGMDRPQLLSYDAKTGSPSTRLPSFRNRHSRSDPSQVMSTRTPSTQSSSSQRTPPARSSSTGTNIGQRVISLHRSQDSTPSTVSRFPAIHTPASFTQRQRHLQSPNIQPRMNQPTPLVHNIVKDNSRQYDSGSKSIEENKSPTIDTVSPKKLLFSSPSLDDMTVSSLAQILDTSFAMDENSSQVTAPTTNNRAASSLASLICLSLLERPMGSGMSELLERPSPQRLVKASLQRHFSVVWSSEMMLPETIQQAIVWYQGLLANVQSPKVDRPETLRKLVVLHLAVGKLKPALQYSTEALQLYRQQQRPLQAALSAMELGLVQFGLFKMGKALKTWREAIQLACLAAGYDTIHIATLLCNIGVLHFETGDTAAGLRTLEESLEMQRTLMKAQTSQVEMSLFRLGTTMANAGCALQKNQQHRQALTLFDESCSVFGSLSGSEAVIKLVKDRMAKIDALGDAMNRSITEEDPTISQRDDISLATDGTGDTARSSVLFGNSDGIPDRRVAARLSRVPSDNHDFILLGPLYPEQTAEERIRNTVMTWFGRQIDQKNTPFVSYDDYDFRNSSYQHESIPVDLDLELVPNAELRLQEIYTQAMHHMDHHENEDALDLFRGALRSHRAKYGDEHHLVGTALHNIGMVHLFAKQYPDALSAFAEATKIRRAALGPDHPNVQSSQMKIGLIQFARGEFMLAQSIFIEVRDKFLEVLGHGHPQMAKIMNNLGVVACQLGDYQSGYLSLEKAYNYQRRLAEDDPQEEDLAAIANSLTNMAFVRYKQGNMIEALQLYETALDRLRSIRNASDPLVVLISRNIDHLVGRNMISMPACRQCPVPPKEKQPAAGFGLDDDDVREDPPQATSQSCQIEHPFEVLEELFASLARVPSCGS